MPNLTYTVSDFIPFTKILSADVNSRFSDIRTLLNTTKLDSTNVQQYGLTRDRLIQGTASHVIINDGSGVMSSEAQLAYTRGGTGISPTFSSNGGRALIVNDAETAFTLGSPLQSTLTQSFTGDIATLTAGEGITANDAVCLDLHNGTGSDVYRVFRCDSDLANRRRNFIGFAVSDATVTAGIYTYTISAAFVASNVIATTINGRSYSTTYASSSDATLQAVATQIATDPDVQSATVTVVGGNQTGTDDRVITVTGKGGLSLNMSASVSGGASQPTVTVANTQSPSGQNVRIRNFGLLSGFSGLTVGQQYYLSSTTGSITISPSDANPIPVGQALTTTQLFITPNSFIYQFTTPSVFVRSHGKSTGSAGSATQDVEHFNFTSWASGTSSSAGARYVGGMGGNGRYNNEHHTLDGNNTSGSISALFQKYNKATWSTLTNRSTAHARHADYEFVGYLHACKGTTGSVQTTHDKWNGSSWSSGTAFNTAANQSGCFSVNSLLNVMGGDTTTDHETMNASDVRASATVAPNGSFTGGSSCTGGSVSPNGIYLQANAGTNSYKWNGSSWSSAITVPHAVNGGSNSQTAAAGHNPTTSRTYINGGCDGSDNGINSTAYFNDTSWASDTASSNSRGGPTGSVV